MAIDAKESTEAETVPPADGPQPEVLKRKELIARIAKRAGMRPNQVRAIAEATLNELGEAMVSGETLNVPALGKLDVRRHKDAGAADIMFAPVITRFETYGIEMDDICRTYAHNVMTWQPVVEWCDAAKSEPWIIEKYDSA